MRLGPKERQRLVDSNVPFVRAISAKIKESLPREIEFDDLVAYGMQGLLEAAERFDGRVGTSFTTFAYYRVRGAVFDGLRGMGWLPRGEYARLRFEERAAAYLGHLADREAGLETHQVDSSIEHEVRQLAEALGNVAAIFVTTLDSHREEMESTSLSPAPHTTLEKNERDRLITHALASLPDKERRLLHLYYYEDRSLAEAGAALGLSKSWSSRLHARAIELLKAALATSDLGTAEGEAGQPPEQSGEKGQPSAKRRARR